jgi:type II secretory pathway pseudopilin PulG
MFRIISILLCLSIVSTGYARGLPIWQQDNYRWQQLQIQHLQTQQQLQAQDQYRRQLLLQDQERQIQKLRDQQDQLEETQRSITIHGYSDRLKMYSKPANNSPAGVKKKQK